MKGSQSLTGRCNTIHIEQLKRLNQVIFPVSYHDKFSEDKFAFEITETKSYYGKTELADAYVLQENLKVPFGQNAESQESDKRTNYK
uniref:Uncharacterized protein n=1 Tax=Sciurus vulgaris TaxID=55149 RepID=A0A8D2AD78_SCIVU